MRPYEPRDYPEIIRWFRARRGKEAGIPEKYFPKTGFIIEGLAACFLYKTDSALAIIDLMISNPDAPKDKTRDALDWVVWHCIREAESQGFTMITATTVHKAVCERAKKHGFDIWENYYQLSLIL